MNKISNTRSAWLAVILFPILVSACSVSLQSTASPNLTRSTSIQFATPSITVTPTTEPVALTTFPISTSTPFPFPTMSSQERETYLLDYFKGLDECRFPCWLGITPGVTTFSEFQPIIQHLGLRYSPKNFNTNYRQQVTLGGLDYDSKQVLNRITLIIEPGGTISGVEGILHAYLNPVSFSTTWNTLDIKEVLLNYGMPSMISILTDYNDATNRIGYSIQVYYFEQGFAVYYNGGADYQNGVNICPHLKNYQLITVSFSLQAPPFKGKANSPQGSYAELDTEIGMNELYALFTSQKDACLKVSAGKFK